MPEAKNTFPDSTVPKGVGDAVGMEKAQWYVAIVKHNTEKKCAEKMDKMGMEIYIPIQSEYKVWRNGRKAKVDRVVIPSTVFIKCTEKERREIVKLPFINRFMTNKAGNSTDSLHKPLAVIPDYEMELLKFMVGNSESPVTISEKSLKKGDLVKVVRGKLKGLEGEIVNFSNDHSELIVTLGVLGCARLQIDIINVEKIIKI